MLFWLKMKSFSSNEFETKRKKKKKKEDKQKTNKQKKRRNEDIGYLLGGILKMQILFLGGRLSLDIPCIPNIQTQFYSKKKKKRKKNQNKTNENIEVLNKFLLNAFMFTVMYKFH